MFLVMMFVGGCGGAPDTKSAASDKAKQAWIQPTSPERADELRQRLMYGQADH